METATDFVQYTNAGPDKSLTTASQSPILFFLFQKYTYIDVWKMNIQYRKIEIEQANYSNKQIDKRSFLVEYWLIYGIVKYLWYSYTNEIACSQLIIRKNLKIQDCS